MKISDNVMSIGDRAFDGCSSLTSITIPDKVTSIGEGTFRGCRCLTSITIPGNVTSIGIGAFYGCEGLTSITIPNSVKSIEHQAFHGCGISSIIIPNSVTSIGEEVFIGCPLETIPVSEGNTVYDSRCNCNAIIKTSTNALIVGCNNTVIPNNVENIGYTAFAYCSKITSVDIPNGVKSISDYAFVGCSGLTLVTIPNNVTSIGEFVFSKCSALEKIKVSVGNPVYDSRKNCNAIIETSTNKLITGSKNTVIPDDVMSIGNGAFCGCSDLTSIVIPNSVTSIGRNAFEECALTSISLPNSLTSISENTFRYCMKLTYIDIPDGVTSIGNGVFRGCTELTSITIPKTVTTIGSDVFSNTGLKSICIKATVPPAIERFGIREEFLYGSCTLYVPTGTEMAYRSADVWGRFYNIIENDNITSVDAGHVRITADDGAIYGVNGQRMTGKPMRGLYIKNGKKYLTR